MRVMISHIFVTTPAEVLKLYRKLWEFWETLGKPCHLRVHFSKLSLHFFRYKWVSQNCYFFLVICYPFCIPTSLTHSTTNIKYFITFILCGIRSNFSYELIVLADCCNKRRFFFPTCNQVNINREGDAWFRRLFRQSQTGPTNDKAKRHYYMHKYIRVFILSKFPNEFMCYNSGNLISHL